MSRVSASLQQSRVGRESWLQGTNRLSTYCRKRRRKALKIIQGGHSRPPVEYPHLGREAEVLNGALEITQRGMVKRSYGSIWQTVFVSFDIETLTPRRIDSYIFSCKEPILSETESII